MKNYLVIGGSSGIGAAIVDILGTENNIYATYLKHSRTSSNQKIKYYSLDITEDSIDLDFLPEVIDGVVYCPGSINLKPFSRTKPEEYIADFQLNVIGAIKIIQAVLPNLKRSSSASIILFSTVAVQQGFGFHSIVSSSKGAIEGLTRALAAEISPNIRVNCIAPSITDTPLAGHILSNDEKKANNAKRHPLNKIGEPADLAYMVAFLLSEKASWMTGQIIHVDGGMSSIKM